MANSSTARSSVASQAASRSPASPSHHQDAPDTGRRYDIFGHGGAAAAAEGMGLPFLGEGPLEMTIRESSDAGRPVVAIDPGAPQSAPFIAIAREVLRRAPQLQPR